VNDAMDLYNFYQKVAVTISCKNNRGSGCLYQPNTQEYLYVLTAKHCLKGKSGEEISFEIEDIEIIGSEELNGGLKIKVIDYLLHNQLDIAIIIVEFIADFPQYMIANPNKLNPIVLNGYPDFMNGERKSLKCSLHEWSPSKPKFETIVSDGQLTSYGNSETDLVEGFSGSGVFNEIDGYPFLIGIFPAFKADGGAYQSLEVIKAGEFNKLLEGNKKPPLIPNYLASFQDHIFPAFEARSKNIGMLLSRRAEEILKITPMAIKELLKEKLVLPYGEINLSEKNLWMGWITLLTYLYIESGNDELDKLLSRDRTGQKQGVKLFYVQTSKRLEDLFKLIIDDTKIYRDIGANDCIVINHEGKSGEIVRLSRKRMGKIVTDIGVHDLKFRHKIPTLPNIPNIDHHTITKDISIMHVDCFTDEFKKFVDIEDFDELEESLRCSITEVLNNE
jgi:hypothetical protein